MAHLAIPTETLLSKSGASLPVSSLEGKILMLYFSASWCPPCRSFTPQLASYYAKLPRDKVEIIFISMDKDESAFQSYYQKMPWLAMPFALRKEQSLLAQRFQVRGIPSLVILDRTGSVVTTNGRMVVAADPNGEAFPYTTDSAEALAAKVSGGMNFRLLLFAVFIFLVYKYLF